MGTIFAASLASVLRLCIICGAGAWLARRGLMPDEFRRLLSRLVVVLMLPCLLIVNLSASASWENLRQWTMLPVMAVVFVLAGLALGKLAVMVRPPAAGLARTVTIASAFGNSGYVPYPLVLAIASTAPLFRDDPGAADRGIAYVSIYLVAMSPCLWGLAYPLLANKPIGHLRPGQVLSPPVVSVLIGIVIGVVPFLRGLFVEADAPLRLILSSAETIGQGAIPCALLILGANLASAGPQRDGVDVSSVASVALVRLLLLPAIGFVAVLWLRRLGLIPADPMCALVLMLEATTPPATNLIVMCQVHNQGSRAMSTILLWTYLAAVPLLTVLVAVYLWALSSGVL